MIPGGKVYRTEPGLQLPPNTSIYDIPVEKRALYLDPHQDPNDPELLRTDFSNRLSDPDVLKTNIMLLQKQLESLEKDSTISTDPSVNE